MTYQKISSKLQKENRKRKNLRVMFQDEAGFGRINKPYFVHRLTNAIAEGINNLIQVAKRKARGFKTLRGFACMIYLVAGKLDLACGSPFPR